MDERLENVSIDDYITVLTEPHRPPSRGGNTKARHSHALVIRGQKYWFVAPGSKRWVLRRDTVSFSFKRDGEYLQILPGSLEVRDRDGNIVTRGLREFKSKLRTAETRLPASRREARD